MKVQYIGKQKPHRERLYGTRTLFTHPGVIQEIEDPIAKKMINNHPDQYAEPSSDFDDEDESLKQPSLIDDGDVDSILIDGKLLKFSKVSKDVLIDIAKNSYEVEIPSSKSKADVAAIISDLIAQYGQPEG